MISRLIYDQSSSFSCFSLKVSISLIENVSFSFFYHSFHIQDIEQNNGETSSTDQTQPIFTPNTSGDEIPTRQTLPFDLNEPYNGDDSSIKDISSVGSNNSFINFKKLKKSKGPIVMKGKNVTFREMELPTI